MGHQLLAYTSSNRNKQSVLSSLFLIFFVVYSISPLSCTCTVKKIVDRIYAANGLLDSGQNLNILLLEVICANMDAKNSDHANAPLRVLVRKARAILTEDSNSSFALVGHATLSEDIPALFDNFLSGLPVSGDKQESIWELNPLHSGPSPPTA